MLNITYLAILEPGEDGSYGISFPDLPGCFSFADNLMEATQMATEAASLHVYNMELDGEIIPTPSTTFPKEETEGRTPRRRARILREYRQRMASRPHERVF